MGDAWEPRWCWRRGFTDVTKLVQDGTCDFASEGHLRCGMKLAQTFRGEVHWVYVVPALSGNPPTWEPRKWGRYVYRGRRYKTLTAIARQIIGLETGHPRPNGDRFFGLRRRRRGRRQ